MSIRDRWQGDFQLLVLDKRTLHTHTHCTCPVSIHRQNAKAEWRVSAVRTAAGEKKEQGKRSDQKA